MEESPFGHRDGEQEPMLIAHGTFWDGGRWFLVFGCPGSLNSVKQALWSNSTGCSDRLRLAPGRAIPGGAQSHENSGLVYSVCPLSHLPCPFNQKTNSQLKIRASDLNRHPIGEDAEKERKMSTGKGLHQKQRNLGCCPPSRGWPEFKTKQLQMLTKVWRSRNFTHCCQREENTMAHPTLGSVSGRWGFSQGEIWSFHYRTQEPRSAPRITQKWVENIKIYATLILETFNIKLASTTLVDDSHWMPCSIHEARGTKKSS